MLNKYRNPKIILPHCFFIYTFLILILTTSCSSKRRLQNEENPFYKRGMQLQQDGNYEDAVAAFNQCLQHSPTSYKANLQLALIYEDYKQDYPQAIINYKMYLENSTEIEDLDIAEQWLRRVERKYFEALRLAYGDPVAEGDSHSSVNKDGEKRRISSNDYPAKDLQQMGNNINKATAETFENSNSSSDFSSADNFLNDEETSSYYIVQEGDTLVDISKKLFGSQKYWEDLYEYNQDVLAAPEVLKIGQRLRIPPISTE